MNCKNLRTRIEYCSKLTKNSVNSINETASIETVSIVLYSGIFMIFEQISLLLQWEIKSCRLKNYWKMIASMFEMYPENFAFQLFSYSLVKCLIFLRSSFLIGYFIILFASNKTVQSNNWQTLLFESAKFIYFIFIYKETNWQVFKFAWLYLWKGHKTILENWETLTTSNIAIL